MHSNAALPGQQNELLRVLWPCELRTLEDEEQRDRDLWGLTTPGAVLVTRIAHSSEPFEHQRGQHGALQEQLLGRWRHRQAAREEPATPLSCSHGQPTACNNPITCSGSQRVCLPGTCSSTLLPLSIELLQRTEGSELGVAPDRAAAGAAGTGVQLLLYRPHEWAHPTAGLFACAAAGANAPPTPPAPWLTASPALSPVLRLLLAHHCQRHRPCGSGHMAQLVEARALCSSGGGGGARASGAAEACPFLAALAARWPAQHAPAPQTPPGCAHGSGSPPGWRRQTGATDDGAPLPSSPAHGPGAGAPAPGVRRGVVPLLVPRGYLLACALLQRLAGVLLAGLLLTCWGVQGVERCRRAAVLALEAGSHWSAWVMTARPGGVKLHAELCEVLGSLVLWVLGTLQALAMAPAFAHLVRTSLALLAAASLVAGVQGVCVCALHLALATTAPLSLLHAGFALAYRTQLRGLTATWRMMQSRFRASGCSGGSRGGAAAVGGLHVFGQWVCARALRVLRRRHAAGGLVGAGVAGIGANKPQLPAVLLPGGQQQQQAAAGAMAGLPWGWQQPQLAGQEVKAGLEQPGHKQVQHTQQRSSRRAQAALRDTSLWGTGQPPAASREVVLEEMVVGVLLFVPLLVLLPTTLAWHLLVVAPCAAMAALRAVLCALRAALQMNPLVLVAWAWLAPASLPGNMALNACPGVCVHVALRCHEAMAVATAGTHKAWHSHLEGAVQRRQRSGAGSTSWGAAAAANQAPQWVRVYQLCRLGLPLQELLLAWWHAVGQGPQRAGRSPWQAVWGAVCGAVQDTLSPWYLEWA